MPFSRPLKGLLLFKAGGSAVNQRPPERTARPQNTSLDLYEGLMDGAGLEEVRVVQLDSSLGTSIEASKGPRQQGFPPAGEKGEAVRW